MGVFAGIGRSTVPQVGQTIFKDAMAVGQQEFQGNMGLLQAQEAQKRGAILEAEEARKAQEDARKQEAFAKEKEFTDKQFNIKFSPLLTVHKDAEDYQQRFEQLRQLTGADEMGNTTQGNMLRGTAEMSKHPEMLKAWFKPRLDALEAEIHANNDKLYKAKLLGDEDAVKKLTGIQQTLQDQYLMKSGEYGKKLMESEKRKGDEAKAELAERKQELAERKQTRAESDMDRRLALMERIARSKADGKELSFADKEAIRTMGRQLSTKTKPAAETANKNVAKIDRMLALIDKGAGGVKGDIFAKINRAADIFRTTPPETAQYNTLRTELMGFAGQLRLSLGLIGQTSDRDVKIMQEAGGMRSPAETQKAILKGYREQFLQDIDVYNSDAAAYNEYSEAGKKLYKPIPVPTVQSPAATSGNWVFQNGTWVQGK